MGRSNGRKQGIVRVRKRTSPFAIMDKRFLSDPRLSWGAKGLMAYLLGQPDDWKVLVVHLVKQSKDGHASCRARLRELASCGYLRRMCVRDRRTGRVLRWETVIFETPELAARAEDQGGPTLFEQFTPYQSDAKSDAKPAFQANTPDVENLHLEDLDVVEPDLGPPDVAHPDVDNPTLPMNDGRKNDSASNDERGTTAVAVDGLSPGGGKSLSVGAPGPVASSLGAAPDASVVVMNPDDTDPVLLLVGSAFGFTASDATRLVRQSGADAERVKLVLLHARGKQRGWVVQALRLKWSLDPINDPVGRRAIDRAAHALAQQAQQQQDATAQAALVQELAEQERLLATLTPEQWTQHLLAIAPTLPARAREAVEAGQGATNPLVRVAVYARAKGGAT